MAADTAAALLVVVEEEEEKAVCGNWVWFCVGVRVRGVRIGGFVRKVGEQGNI